MKIIGILHSDQIINIIFCILLSALTGILKPLLVLVSAKCIGIVISRDIDKIVFQKQLYMFIYLGMISFISSYLQSMFWISLSKSISNSLLKKYYKYIYNNSTEWFENEKDVMDSANLKFTAIQMVISEKLPLLIQFMCTVISSYIYSICYGHKLAALILLIFPVSIIGNYLSSRISSLELRKRLIQITNEILEGFRTILLFNRVENEKEKYINIIDSYYKTNNRILFYQGLISSISHLICQAIYIISLVYCKELLKVNYKFEDLFLVYFSLMISLFYFVESFKILHSLSDFHKHMVTIYKQITTSKIDDEGIQPDDFLGEIEFKDVSFATISSKSKLDKLSFKLTPGNSIAFYDINNHSNDIIFNLLEMIKQPTEGTILIDGFSTKDYYLPFLRTKIGWIKQYPFIFDASIYENITWPLIKNDSTSMDRCINACKAAHIHDYILNMKNKYNEVADVEKIPPHIIQKIGIARSIVNNPKILLLDHINQDETYTRLLTSLIRKNNSKSVILSTQDLALAKQVDTVILLNKGRVVESGNHLNLMNKKGIYYKLTKSQEMRLYKSNTGKSIEASSESTQKSIMEISLNNIKVIKQESGIKITPHAKIKKAAMKYKIKFTLSILTSLLEGIIPTVHIYLLLLILVKFISEKDLDIIIEIILLILLSILSFIAENLKYGVFFCWENNIQKNLQIEAYKKLLDQDLSYYGERNNGITLITKKLYSGIEKLTLLVTRTGYLILSNIAALLLMITTCYYINFHFLFFFIVIIPFILAVFLYKYLIKGIRSKTEIDIEELSNKMKQFVDNIELVDVLNLKYITNNIINATEFTNKKRIEYLLAPLAFSIFQSSEYFIAFWGYFIVFYYFTPQQDGDLTKYLLVNIGILCFVYLAYKNYPHFYSIFRINQIGANVFKLFDPHYKNDLESIDCEFNGNIEFNGVHFSYPLEHDVPILKGLNLHLKKNTVIVGMNNTVISDLLLKLYKCNEGEIVLSGIDINNWNPIQIRKQIVVIDELPLFFNGTISENILFSSTEVSIDLVFEVSKLAKVHDIIMELPDGYDSNIKDENISLPVRQLISIARALICKPKLIILNHVYDHLIRYSKDLTLALLKNIENDTTLINVTDCFYNIWYFDLIAIYKDGKIVESGSHDELMGNGHLYSSMFKQQGPV